MAALPGSRSSVRALDTITSLVDVVSEVLAESSLLSCVRGFLACCIHHEIAFRITHRNQSSSGLVVEHYKEWFCHTCLTMRRSEPRRSALVSVVRFARRGR